MENWRSSAVSFWTTLGIQSNDVHTAVMPGHVIHWYSICVCILHMFELFASSIESLLVVLWIFLRPLSLALLLLTKMIVTKSLFDERPKFIGICIREFVVCSGSAHIPFYFHFYLNFRMEMKSNSTKSIDPFFPSHHVARSIRNIMINNNCKLQQWNRNMVI